MRSLFLYLVLLFLPFFAFSDENFEQAHLTLVWIDENTLQISGGSPGGGGSANPTITVITNFFGTCTNCVNISPSEMHDIKISLIAALNDTTDVIQEISDIAQLLEVMCTMQIDSIGTYIYNDIIPNSTVAVASNAYFRVIAQDPYTYDYVRGKQGELTKRYFDTKGVDMGGSRLGILYNVCVSYANAIYDYANQVEASNLSDIKVKAVQIDNAARGYVSRIDNIKDMVSSISEDACECANGSGGNSCSNGTSSQDCPCREQMNTLLGYVQHLDSDFHADLNMLQEMHNSVLVMEEVLESYARVVSSTLVNVGTIVVDRSTNSWFEVYNRGSSQLYDYNSSNILQRIELLLYGLAAPRSSSSISNDFEFADISELNDRIEDSVDDAKRTIEDANEDYGRDLDSLRNSLLALWRSMSFFGSGQLQNFALVEPTRVFGEYDLDFEITRATDLSDLQRICRICFQIFYSLCACVFMIVFWFKVVTFIYEKAIFVLKFFNTLLT